MALFFFFIIIMIIKSHTDLHEKIIDPPKIRTR